jgi:hypothetical protein
MKLAILVAAAMACTTPAWAQGGGGGKCRRRGRQQRQRPVVLTVGNENQGTTGNLGATAIRNAETRGNIKPTSPSSSTVSAPGVETLGSGRLDRSRSLGAYPVRARSG